MLHSNLSLVKRSELADWMGRMKVLRKGLTELHPLTLCISGTLPPTKSFNSASPVLPKKSALLQKQSALGRVKRRGN